MELKKCTLCKEDKPLNNFNKNNTKKSGLGNVCKACSKVRNKKYYEENSSVHKTNVRKRTRELRNENRLKIRVYLETHPCVDCNESDYVVLDFDHKNSLEKKENVSVLLGTGYNWNTIKAEIDKCDVRCANCHRRRTAIQFGWYN